MSILYEFYTENKNLNFPESFTWIEQFFEEVQQKEFYPYSNECLLSQAYEMVSVENQDLISFFKSILNYYVTQHEVISSKDELYGISAYLVDKGEISYVLNFIQELLRRITENNEFFSLNYPIELENVKYEDDKYCGETLMEKFTLDWLDYQDGERTTIPEESIPYSFDEYPIDCDFEYEIQEYTLSQINHLSDFIVKILKEDKELNLVQKLNCLRDMRFVIHKYFSVINAKKQLILEYHKMKGYFELLTLEEIYTGRIFLERVKMYLLKFMPLDVIDITEEQFSEGYSECEYTVVDSNTFKPIIKFSTYNEKGVAKISGFRIFEVNNKQYLNQNYLLLNYFFNTMYSLNVSKTSLERLIDDIDKAHLKTVYVKNDCVTEYLYSCDVLDEELEKIMEEENYEEKQVHLFNLNEKYLCFDGRDIFICDLKPIINNNSIDIEQLPF